MASVANQFSATQAAREIAAGRLTSETLVRACLARIAEREATVQAWAFLDPDLAIEQARACDRGPRRGVLHGVPVGVKDVIDTADMPTAYNSAVYGGYRPRADAACIAAARRAGAVILGGGGVQALVVRTLYAEVDRDLRAVAAQLEAAGFRVAREVLPDDRWTIAALLTRLADEERVPLVVVTGGTGLGPRDVTPEATRDVIEREVPGFAEAMRAAGRAITPRADLSRGVCGVRGTTLIVDLPGSPKGATESLAAIVGLLGHAIALIGGDTAHRGEP